MPSSTNHTFNYINIIIFTIWIGFLPTCTNPILYANMNSFLVYDIELLPIFPHKFSALKNSKLAKKK
jgi:hypothetical protein